MMRVKYQPVHDFKCCEPGCGHVQPIARRKNARREKGHVKDLWCIKCKKTTKHTESYNEYERVNSEFKMPALSY